MVTINPVPRYISPGYASILARPFQKPGSPWGAVFPGFTWRRAILERGAPRKFRETHETALPATLVPSGRELQVKRGHGFSRKFKYFVRSQLRAPRIKKKRRGLPAQEAHACVAAATPECYLYRIKVLGRNWIGSCLLFRNIKTNLRCKMTRTLSRGSFLQAACDTWENIKKHEIASKVAMILPSTVPRLYKVPLRYVVGLRSRGCRKLNTGEKAKENLTKK